MRTALAAGHRLKGTYSLAITCWHLIVGLWAANDLPLPPNALVRSHLCDLHGPDQIETQFQRLFLADPPERSETRMWLLSWGRERLATPLRL